MQQRVGDVENFFGDLCAELVSYTRRTAKLRNNGDEIARILLDYSVKEKINRSSAATLKKLSEHLATLEDHRHTEVDRLVGKVVNPLASYGDEIKKIKTYLKTESAARKRELASRKKLERSSTAEQSRQAEIQLHNSILDANKSADTLERSVVEFEARRLKGLKTILSDFIQIEMLWHAKALETLSESFNSLQSLHEEADLLNFRSTLMRSGSDMTNVISELQLHRHSLGSSGRLYQKPSDLSYHSPRSARHPGASAVGDHRHHHSQQVSSGLPHTSRQRGEDITSLFSEDEDEVSEDRVHSRSVVCNHSSGDHVEDVDDEDSQDDEDGESEDEDEESESEYTHTGATTTASIRKNVHGATKITSQSPLKSALKSSGSKQAT